MPTYLDTLKEQIYVNSTGILCNTKEFNSTRVTGRNDCMLIYLVDGSGTIFSNNKDYPMERTNLIFFPPNTPLTYTFSKDTTHYWLHFSGELIETLFKNIIPVISNTNIGCLKCKNHHEIITHFSKLTTERNAIYQSQIISSAYMLMIVNEIYIQSIKSTPITGSTALYRLLPAINFINENSTQNYPMKFYADLCNYSESYFKHLFIKYVGKSVTEYIIKMRVENAKELLLSSDLKLEDIALSVGFANQSHFTRTFKQHYMIAPSTYRKTHSNKKY